MNQKYNVEIFGSRVLGGKAYQPTEIQRIEKNFFQSKRLHKATSAKRFDKKNKLICKATENLNSTCSQKYGYAPDAGEKKAAESKKFRDIQDFYRFMNVRQHAKRYERADIKKIKNYEKENHSELEKKYYFQLNV